jgi:membrane protein required for colicin V production
MIWIDWVLLGVLAVSTIIGLWRGLVREVMSILIWVVAIWAALRYSEVAAGYLSGWITMPSMQGLVGFAGVLLVTLAVGGLLVWLIGKLVDSTGLSGTDRTFGMLFGVARGVIIIAVAVLVARFTVIPQDPWWQESTLLPHFERIAEEGVTLLPPDVQEMLQVDADQTNTNITDDTGDPAAADPLDAAAVSAASVEQMLPAADRDKLSSPPAADNAEDSADD